MAKPTDATLRTFAGQKGYEVERAQMKGCWRLKDAAGETARNPLTGSAAFTINEAIAFLKTKPDTLGW
jgi:hypothetical protein